VRRQPSASDAHLLRVVCAWCRRTIREPTPGPGEVALPRDSHGMCLTCARVLAVFPTEDLFEYEPADYDRLPFGLVELDAAGRVCAYNAAEASLSGLGARQIIGRPFFSEVAPCTRVQEFEGVYDRLVADGGGVHPPFHFVFRFAGGDRLVEITLAYDPVRERGQLHLWELAGEERGEPREEPAPPHGRAGTAAPPTDRPDRG
jgi:photoactive yellow protein